MSRWQPRAALIRLRGGRVMAWVYQSIACGAAFGNHSFCITETSSRILAMRRAGGLHRNGTRTQRLRKLIRYFNPLPANPAADRTAAAFLRLTARGNSPMHGARWFLFLTGEEGMRYAQSPQGFKAKRSRPRDRDRIDPPTTGLMAGKVVDRWAESPESASRETCQRIL